MEFTLPTTTAIRVLDEANYEFVTTHEDRFEEEIRHMEEQINWIHDLETKELNLIPMDGPVFAKQYAEDYGIDEDLVYSTMDRDGSSLMLSDLRNTWCVGTTCITALSERAKLFGSALGRMNPTDFSTCLNLGFANARDGKTLGYEVYGKMASLHAEGNYEIMPISELVSIARNTLTDDFGYANFIQGVNRVDMTTCIWELPNAKDVITKAYKKALMEAHMNSNYDVEDMMPVIKFQTSNTANSSAFLFPMFKCGCSYIPLVSNISVRHDHVKDSTGIELFKKESHEIWSRFRETSEKVKELAETMISHGPNCVVSLCKRYGIPRKYGSIAYEQIDGFTGNGIFPISAHDIYMSIARAVGQARTMKASLQTIFQLEENVAKILSADWSDHDVAGNLGWGK